MKLKYMSLLLMLFSWINSNTYASSIDISSVTPNIKLTDDIILAEFLLTFSTTGFNVDPFPTMNTIGNDINVEIHATSPIGIVLPVIIEQSYPVNLGSFSVGTYSLYGQLFIDDTLMDTAFTTFSVSAVPVPASIWLFLSGFLLISYFTKKPNNSLSLSVAKNAPPG